jgi:hypothetical protein
MAVLGLLALPFMLAGWIISGVATGGEWAVRYFLDRRERRRTAIEAELDRKQAELRGTILQLADALGVEAHEARKALIRESYRASGAVPTRPE